MIWFALLATFAPASDVLPRSAVQDGTVAYSATAELYEAPPVRPFEPRPGFAGGEAEGDAPNGAMRRPLTGPVVVEAYRGAYEASPSDTEVAYDQGVTQAELSMDVRMGPLDGRWRVTASDGTDLLHLVMSDRGGSRPVEGGWFRPAAAGSASELGPLGAVTRAGSTVVIPVPDSDGRLELRLQPAGDGWTGVLSGDGPDRTVRMSRPS